jgi:hypothetical protein
MRLRAVQGLNRECERSKKDRIPYGPRFPAAEKSRLHPPPNPCYQATRSWQQLIRISSLLK